MPGRASSRDNRRDRQPTAPPGPALLARIGPGRNDRPWPYVPGGESAGLVVGDTGADSALDDGAPVSGYPGLTGCYAQYLAAAMEL
jgi:NADPH:quinone reductase-like Zn-dependent oxidoreductase